MKPKTAMKKRTIFRPYYVVVNTENFDIRISRIQRIVAGIVGISENTMNKVTKRTVYNGFIIVPVLEE